MLYKMYNNTNLTYHLLFIFEILIANILLFLYLHNYNWVLKFKTEFKLLLIN